MPKRAEADRKKQENRSKRLEKQSNAMGWKLAIFFVFYGLLPLLGLWISKLLLAETVKSGWSQNLSQWFFWR